MENLLVSVKEIIKKRRRGAEYREFIEKHCDIDTISWYMIALYWFVASSKSVIDFTAVSQPPSQRYRSLDPIVLSVPELKA